MIEISHLVDQERIKILPKEVQGTIQGILQILDTEYGADRNKYEDDGGYVDKIVCNNCLVFSIL